MWAHCLISVSLQTSTALIPILLSCLVSIQFGLICQLSLRGNLNTNHYFFFAIIPTRCTNFPNLLRHETLHISGTSSAHHQEFIHCTLGTDICHTGLNTAFEQDQDGTIFTNLFCHETLHVSDSSSVHHQEFIHCTLSNGICHTGL
jgi:hypothetical protein